MASIKGNDHSDTRRTSTLSPPPRSDALIEHATNSVLTTMIDGGAGSTTATAAKSSSSVRSRSKSPHPEGNTLLHGRHQEQEMRSGDRHIVEHDTRDTSFDLQSFISSAGGGSHTDLSSLAGHDDALSGKNGTTGNFRIRLAEKWEESKGLFMIVLSGLFGALMGAVARLMQTGPAPMHLFQIIFARMSITVVLSLAYMRWQRVPDAPFGQPGVRKLLVARGVGGFFGMFGLYFSVKYLPLGEATVITFLAPMVTNAVCSVLLHEPFTRREQIAAVVSLVGVIFIARPTSFFTSPVNASNNNSTVSGNSTATAGASSTGGGVAPAIPEATPVERLVAVLVALTGVGGAACAYTTIRWIGKRAHPLISVTYFSSWCTLVSTVALLSGEVAGTGVSFRLPSDTREWLLLLSLGVFGMVMQFLLTAGLGRGRGSAATNMTYTQMIFVLLIDYALWGTVMTWASWLGCGLILASQIWGVMARQSAQGQQGAKEPPPAGARLQDVPRRPDEEVGLVAAAAQDDEEDEQLEMREMNPVPSATGNERR